MKHAGPASLDALEPLLAEIRPRVAIDPKIVEKKRGSFYRRGKAWLHFHEDPAGYFADPGDPKTFEQCKLDLGERIVSLPGPRVSLNGTLEQRLRGAFWDEALSMLFGDRRDVPVDGLAPLAKQQSLILG